MQILKDFGPESVSRSNGPNLALNRFLVPGSLLGRCFDVFRRSNYASTHDGPSFTLKKRKSGLGAEQSTIRVLKKILGPGWV